MIMTGRSFQSRFFCYSTILSAIIITVGCSVAKVAAPSPSADVSYNVVSDGVKGKWNDLGFQKGERVPNFVLFDADGKEFSLSSALKLAKPVVFITASYTCDITRGNIPAIKQLSSKYGNKANFFMVYVIEPHPIDVPSPYSKNKKVWIAFNNVRENVKASQPKTYQERVNLSKKWKETYDIDLPVLVDNADNYFWTNFGEAPNMVYLISPDRTVYYKSAWFKKSELEKKLQTLDDNS